MTTNPSRAWRLALLLAAAGASSVACDTAPAAARAVVTVTIVGMGTVEFEGGVGAPHTCTKATECTGRNVPLTADRIVFFQATPAPGWSFSQWHGACGDGSTDPATSVEAPPSDPIVCEAVFEQAATDGGEPDGGDGG